MEILDRHNVRVGGAGERAIMFAHGFGCDQNMWRFVAPEFEDDHRVILFDYLGSGRSDGATYSAVRYSSLNAYADDIVTIARELGLRDAILVGHSVSAMIAALASIRAPECFNELIMVSPSPRYMNDQDYVGGFERADIDELLESLSSNYLGWSSTIAPAIMGNPARPELGQELTNSFCQMDPLIAKNFARVTFLSDSRADLPEVRARTLVLQCSQDIIAPLSVGQYVHQHIKGSELVVMDATGHCPNLSAPEETTRHIKTFLAGGR